MIARGLILLVVFVAVAPNGIVGAWKRLSERGSWIDYRA